MFSVLKFIFLSWLTDIFISSNTAKNADFLFAFTIAINSYEKTKENVHMRIDIKRIGKRS